MGLRDHERRQIGALRLVIAMFGCQRVADLFGGSGRPQNGKLYQIQECQPTEQLNWVDHFGELSQVGSFQKS